ncbi:ribonuclease Z [Agriterribacter sp.]|uniref:ribonuclease Z n=1 Tax=Agriterribacter sp. TaxID=2821509 RepID=UPI002B8AA185|nr:ribonuclease Z [Agriterribacter sp.]HRO45062.1 ribonuclease Z [Agriterribacter sp.]HRQ15497.1 ribonuclease Z [Agriterribacter sp.]
MFAVTILGNNSALPMHDRHPTAQVVYYDEHLFLVDCGEGTQIQMNRYKIRRNRIRYIFISHLHGDHYFGLPGLLTSYGLNGRTEDLWIFSPPLLREIIDIQLQAADTVLPYSLHFVVIEKEGILVDEKKITVSCFAVNHRIPCWGFMFKEKNKPLKLDSEKLRKYAIPSSFYQRLKAGEDYITKDGMVIKKEWLTLPVPPVESYAYCADTVYDESIAEKCKAVDLLYHEATYLDDQKEKAAGRMHSTSVQAAAIALKANAGKLLIGHFSSRYETLDDFVTEARAVFPNTDLAIEGATYIIHK